MQKEHPLDRLGRKLRTPIIWSLWVSGPIAVFTYGKAMVDFIFALPVGLAVIVFVAQIMALIGIGSLFDRQSERRLSSGSAQSAPPRQTKQAGQQ